MRVIRPTLVVLVLLLAAAPGCGRRSEGRAAFDPNPSVYPAANGKTGSGVAFAALGLNDALSKARAERKLVMVDVYAEWCGWCKKLDREVFTDARVASALRNVVSIRMDADREERLAEQYRIDSLPTLLFLDPSGKVVKSVSGFVDADQLLRIAASLPRPA